ncbi:hypothetical protein CPter91_1811 [Collimonas pratensis]|uniref:Uncharacterized protein n=1 Tax=Collimonas pratensis TaxID=279113 RepID=A0A127Q2C2_9BURK|nr:hypothetical protein CPter91_1811 [Collimonas pratensis]
MGCIDTRRRQDIAAPYRHSAYTLYMRIDSACSAVQAARNVMDCV